MNNVLLLGASLDSSNEGVNALCYGAIEVIKKNYPKGNITLIEVSSIKKDKIVKVSTKNKIDIDIQIVYISGKMLIGYLLLTSLGFRLKRTRVGKIISQADIVFDINEGDSFSDIYGFKRILRHFSDTKLALNYKKNVVFLPQTLGPFNTFVGRCLAKNILRRLHKLFVRDTKAYDFLERIKIKGELSIDMAVYMPCKVVNIEIQPNTVGININGLMYFESYKNHKGFYSNYKFFLIQLIQMLKSKGLNVLLIPHTYQIENPSNEDDLLAIKDFIQTNKHLGMISYVDKKYTAQELKYIISKLDFFIGSRMHSCIGALSSSVPTYGLAYSYKFEGTFRMFNSDAYVSNLVKLSKDDLHIVLGNIENALNIRDKYRKDLSKINSDRTILTL